MREPSPRRARKPSARAREEGAGKSPGNSANVSRSAGRAKERPLRGAAGMERQSRCLSSDESATATARVNAEQWETSQRKIEVLGLLEAHNCLRGAEAAHDVVVIGCLAGEGDVEAVAGIPSRRTRPSPLPSRIGWGGPTRSPC